jgi:hypothetical protein
MIYRKLKSTTQEIGEGIVRKYSRGRRNRKEECNEEEMGNGKRGI